jgi:hypothetical protein
MLVCSSTFAAPRDFSLTWSSQTLAPGHRDIEVWLTPRIARTDPQQVISDFRVGLSAGLLRSLETQLTVDLGFDSLSRPATIDSRLTSLWRFTPFKATDALGFGGFARVSLGVDVLDLEARVILDKAIGRVLLALNASVTRSLFWSGRAGVDTRLEESVAARFAVTPNATFGFEAYAKSSFTKGEYQGTGLSVGPALSFQFSKVWLTFGLVAQVGADKASADRGNGEPLTLRDNERFVGRVVFGGHLD